MDPKAPEDQKPDMHYVTTEELLNELFSRSIATVVCLIPKAKSSKVSIRIEGGKFTCLGMAQQAVFDMLMGNMDKDKH